MEFMDEIIDFAVTARKLGNLKVLLPKNEFESTNDILKNQDVNVPLLYKMIDHKVKHFKEHTNFITDFELEETEADPILRVYTQTKEAYFSKLSNKIEDQFGSDEYDDNFINRYAIVMKPLQPFLDWYYQLKLDEDIDEKFLASPKYIW
jgi:hypothetical protein